MVTVQFATFQEYKNHHTTFFQCIENNHTPNYIQCSRMYV